MLAIRLSILVLPALLIQGFGRCAFAEAPSIEEVLVKLSASVDACETIEAKYRASFKEDPPAAGAKRDGKGRSILFQFDWKRDRRQQWQLLNCEYGYVQRGRWDYHGYAMSWDGEDFISYRAGEGGVAPGRDPQPFFCTVQNACRTTG